MWLYAPDDTTLAKMKYPHQNELFLSDNCNCDQKLIRPDDVTAQTEITWSPRKIPLISYFVRQTFNTSDQSFRTLQTDDFICSCQKPTVDTFTEMRQRFSLFDTVLVKAKRRGSEILEPCIIEQFDAERELIQVRRLQRAKRDFDCAEARPHELVWTSKFVDVKPEHILRKCKIRMLLNCASPRCSHKACSVPKKIPSIYDRDGQADCFLITKCLEDFGGKEIAVDLIHDQILRFTQGEDFDSSDREKLAAMSLFSGGGNFDRGLQEAGAMRSKWAVEWNANAAHTYRANLRGLDDTAIFLGSIDEHLHRALAGRLSTTVPAIGQVEVLLAGSPCQGFSALQQHRMSLHSMANASKVATVAAYIDLWRPLYAVLENVPEMTRQLGPDKQENVFAQLLCCLVGMGYQVQQLLMDAWSYGEAQSRPRLFIIATAPGLPLLEHPNMTHAHPKDMPAKSLGKAPNKQPYGVRYADTPTYPFITARDATGDLPNIGDGHTHGCLALPDHRPGAIMSPLEQRLICRIPKLPRGQGLVDVFAQREPLPRLLHDWIERQSELRLSSNSKSFQRLDPTKLFRTITTKLTPTDGIAGFGVHWDQDRVLTVMEARRAQGFLDHEVIIGDVTVQWKIIGNSVSRAVALALGMSLRQAWLSITGSSGHAAVGRPPRPGNPLVIIAHPQERVSKAPSTPSVHCSLGPQLRVEAETHAPVHLSMQDTNGRLQTLISTNSRGKHETAFPQPHDLQVSSPVTIRGSPPAVLEEHHSRSALTIRLGQTTARQLPKLETTTIIELDDSGNVINGGHSGSEVPSPKTPGFTIHQDTTAFGYSVQSTASDFGITSENLRYDKNHLKTEMMSANPSNREGRSKEQEVHEIDDGDDDDVVFISSRIVSK
jgi:DNA (cytosine-5)-methyltransferase 1